MVDMTSALSRSVSGISLDGAPSQSNPPPDSQSTAPKPDSAPPANPPKLSDQLSHPVLTTPYPLPHPPHGFKFRPILEPGHEIVISLSLISGRYYPGLLFHPLMAPIVTSAIQVAESANGFMENRHIFAMDGLLPGVHQSMDPQYWRKSRVEMLREADAEARKRFRERWEETKLARLRPKAGEGEGPAPMDVD